MNEVRFGIVGGSSRSWNFCRVISAVKNARLVAICEKIEARLNKTLQKYGTPDIKGYLDYEDMLKNSEIDAVVVCTEPANFSKLTQMALRAGKHVITEVPSAQTRQDLWDMIVAVEKSGLVFEMAEQMRYAPFVTAWKSMVEQGKLGKIVFAEGQYLHGLSPTYYYYDEATGERISYEETKNNPNARKSRIWDTFPHCIYYSPHDLSPLLKVLDDRVIEVTCFMSEPQSAVYPDLPASDIEVALMRTAKGTIIRQATGFTVPVPAGVGHWYHVMGTKGLVETSRSYNEKGRMFLADSQMIDMALVDWGYNWEHDRMLPVAEAADSGHGGLDYYPIHNFVQAILKGTPVEMGVYAAAETAIPAIVAMESAEQGGKPLPVPDVRPNDQRKAGEYPSRL